MFGAASGAGCAIMARMGEERGRDDEGDGRPRNLGELARRMAVLYADHADLYDSLGATFRELHPMIDVLAARHPELPSRDKVVADIEATAYRLRTAQRLHGEVARAHDAMMAGGGPQDTQAYAEYQETMKMLVTLFPDFKGGSELGT
jgi:hypothetical protein